MMGAPDENAVSGGAVLVVDDEDDVRSIVEMLLEHDGFQVWTATNGQEALEAVAQRMPRVILLDLKMPVMSGGEFVRRFRQQYRHAAPIVVMSAIDDLGRRAFEIGAEDWIAKPFDATALTEIVRRHAT